MLYNKRQMTVKVPMSPTHIMSPGGVFGETSR